MSKDKISDYSSTANSNTDIAGINIDEGCAPSGINDAIRTLMAQLKNFQTGTGGDSFNGPFAGTTIAATDTTDASSTTAAAMKTAGGLAVAKKAYIGLDANIYGLTVGRGAGSVSTNTAVGASALAANTSGGGNTAVGSQASTSTTTGQENTVVGQQAFYTNTTGSYNSVLGVAALYANTTGSNNVAIGELALRYNTTASNNTAVGYQAAYANTTGTANSAFGDSALVVNTTGSYNSAIGRQSLASNTTGTLNTAVGQSALTSNTTSSNNVAVGYQALYSYQTGGDNVAVGNQAGYSLNGNGNSTFLGRSAGYSTTGGNNTFVGYQAGYYVSTGAKNTIIGAYTGNQGGLDIRTASNYIVLSDGDGNPRSWATSSGAWVWSDSTATGRRIYFDGYTFGPSTDNAVSCGYSNQRWTVVYAATGTINTSDANQKQDIAALDDAEKRVAVAIKSLIKKYRFKDAVSEKGADARIHIGAVAQEVAAAFVAEGLDPTRYALFCSDTWYEVNGESQDASCVKYTAETPNAVEVTRLGLRYEELLSFVIAAL